MKFLKRLLFLIFVIALAVAAMVVKLGYDKYSEAIESKPLIDAVEEIKSKENYTEYAAVPKIYYDAVVAVEDRRFYLHSGFDIIGTVRALYIDFKEGEMVEGGSTLTQQLAKNMYFPLDNSLTRKIAEVFMAHKIEREYEKDEILELYVNIVYYGSGYYCIYDASMGYFGKTPIEMSDYECTLLAGIPNAPSVYSLNVNPDLAHQRQQKVVESMAECDYITDEEQTEILNNAR